MNGVFQTKSSISKYFIITIIFNKFGGENHLIITLSLWNKKSRRPFRFIRGS